MDDLFTEDARNLGLDVLQLFVMKGKESSFYNCFADLLDLFIENMNVENSWMVMSHQLGNIMDVVYQVDVSNIENWSDFVSVFEARYGDKKLILKKVIGRVLERDHRRPPKPKFYHIAPRGNCRVCGMMIVKKDGLPNKRAHWHPKCAKEYNLIHDPSETRKAVFKRDRGICCQCGTVDERLKGNWDMDHALPLIESQGRIEAWKLSNIQSLCVSCHRDKSAAETRSRAQRRKLNG